jgi:uncharacterized coiled-coil DUF342 family protein
VNPVNHLKYLDLEISNNNRNLVSLDKQKLLCKFDKKYKHILHSENNILFSEHLNSLTDLVINLSINLEKTLEENNNKISFLTSLIEEKNKSIKELRENQDYIRQQNNSILEKLSKQKPFIELNSLVKEVKDIKSRIERIEKIILS